MKHKYKEIEVIEIRNDPGTDYGFETLKVKFSTAFLIKKAVDKWIHISYYCRKKNRPTWVKEYWLTKEFINDQDAYTAHINDIKQQYIEALKNM